jgi:hypothetical protein
MHCASNCTTSRQRDARNQPALLQAEHNVALANRAKQTTDIQAGLDKNAVDQQKLDIQQAMAPANAAAVLATRAIEDAQKLLDLDKLRFDISEKPYATALLLAEAVQKAAEQTLKILKRPAYTEAAPVEPPVPVPASAMAARPAGHEGVPTPASASAGPATPSGPDWQTAPSRFGQHGGAPVVSIDMGGVVMNSVNDAQAIATMVKDQLVAAWNAAMAAHPVSGALGGSYSMRGGPS